MSEDLRGEQERAWRQLEAINAALSRGNITEDGWHEAILSIIEPAYLNGQTLQAGSGYSGDEAQWEYARRVVMEAVNRDGTFLDIGCANGLLMESVARWGAQDGYCIEPYGVDISAALVDVARTRLPHWAHRIWAGNALHWAPKRRFDYVRTGLEYVPPRRGVDFVGHLLSHAVKRGGTLIIGPYNEEPGLDSVADLVKSWGYRLAGRSQRPKPDPRLSYKVLWLRNELD